MTTTTINTAIANLHIGEVFNQPLATYFHYVEVKGRCTTEQAIEYMCEDLGLDLGDTSLHMEAIKYLIGYFITNYWELVLDDTALYTEEEIKELLASYLQHREVAIFEAADNGGGDRFWNAYETMRKEVAA